MRRSASSLSHYTSTSSSGVSPGGPGPPPRCDVIRLGTPAENNRLLYRSSAAGERIPCLRPKPAEYVPKLEHVRELVSAYNEQIFKRQHNPQEADYSAAYADDASFALTSSLMLYNQTQQQRIEHEPIYVNIL